jgi:hypothetical protein
VEINWTSLIGLGFFALAFFRALRVRRDLANGETRWDRALFGSGQSISRAATPVKFWCAIAVNTVVVLLITLVAAVAFRAMSFALRRL